MSLNCYSSRIPNAAAAALSEFEVEFTYPLGPGCRFRISHGDDYLGFFRSMGEATLIVTETDGKITGSLARVKKELVLRRVPGGLACKSQPHYLGDLKVRADWRGSRVLSRLISEAKCQIETSDTIACFSVVMGGTGRLPTDYTGRLGVPPFENLAGITILRLSSVGVVRTALSCRIVAINEIREVVDQMGLAGYQCETAEHPCRSRLVPIHLVADNDDACATLEDTRRVKRLFLDSGEELISAHLSSFRYRTPMAAALLLTDAVWHARCAGFPAVFCAVPANRMESLRPFLADMEVTAAPAAIYGIGMERGVDWWMDTAEI